MSSSAIFYPVFLQMVVTLILYILTYRVRVGLVKSGEAKPSDYKTYENENSESRKWGRAISNQYETPVIFYALCLIAFVTGPVSTLTFALAWVYSILKTIHVYIHVSKNRLRYRQPAFGLCVLVLLFLLISVCFEVAIA